MYCVGQKNYDDEINIIREESTLDKAKEVMDIIKLDYMSVGMDHRGLGIWVQIE